MLARMSCRARPLTAGALALLAIQPAVAQDRGYIASSPQLGQDEGRCRKGAGETSFDVSVQGLKDSQGTLKLEVYPATKDDFLADDNKLVMAGKTFRRVVQTVPSGADPHMCIRLPGPGTYALVLLHDRDNDRKFKWTYDGIGFAGNPKLGWGKPDVHKASARAGSGATPVSIVMNYKHGLGMGPLKRD